MALQKRRKLSSDDIQTLSMSEIGLSVVNDLVDDDEEDEDVEGSVMKTSSVGENEILNDLITDGQGPSLNNTPDKYAHKRNKSKGKDCEPTRISERLIIKRNRLGDAEDECVHSSQTETPPRKGKGPSKTASKQLPPQKKVTKNRKPTCKAKPVWTHQDQKLFYIYLGEYGKNFETISKKISASAKMRGLPQKGIDQVRYFYYRCWSKISKFIHMEGSEGVKPVTQELYGLINYGVLRDYIRENHPDFARCLNEMIHSGKTSYTIKTCKPRRIVRLKTPQCRYLKKINKIEDQLNSDTSSSSKIPSDVTLMLTPKNSSSWAKVQELSQNPRIRFKLSTNRTLESVFRYLGTKWKSNRVKLKEALGGETEELNEELIFTLHPSSKISPVNFIPQAPRKLDVTFNNYRENILPLLVKNKKTRTNKDQEKNEKKCVSTSSEFEIKKSLNDPTEPLSKINSNVDTGKISPCEAIECTIRDSISNLKTDSFDSKSPLSELPSITSRVPGLPEDENAVFMDLAKYSKPATPENNVTEPHSPSISVTCKSSSPSSKQSILSVSVPSPHSELNMSPSCLSSPLSSSNVILSPSLQKKRSAKSTKKRTLSLDSNPQLLQEACDIHSYPNALKDTDSSHKLEAASAATKNVQEESKRDLERVSSLAHSGYTLGNSNNITLLHLCLLLGRANVIKMEYEWKEKIKPNPEILPAFCRVTSQMANVLRRLSNIAQLELTSYPQDKLSDGAKMQNKCDNSSAKSNISRGRKKEGMRDVSTMTDPLKHAILSCPNTQSRTYIAANTSQALQDSVFRVPLVPAFRPAGPTKEEQQKMILQEQQAKAIMQQGQKTRLLKRRNVTPRSRKQPPIIVQRTLLPKVSSPMITYIQGPGVQSQVMLNFKTEDGLPAQPVAATTTSNENAEALKQVTLNGSNILSLAVQAAEINETTVGSPDQIPEGNLRKEFSSLESNVSAVLSSSSSFKSTSDPLPSESPMKISSVSSQADISLSDFDISMTSTNISNMGPDAGDRFLDSVLQNSQQGFSGLIESSKKAGELVSGGNSQLQSISVDTVLANLETNALQTPLHSTASYQPSTPSLEYPSPMNLNIPDQPWLSADSTDLSFGSILGESSSFHGNKPKLKSPCKSSNLTNSDFFDNSSSDGVDHKNISLSKPLFASDVSLSCLLNDSNLGAPKNVESLRNLNSSKNSSENIFSTGVNAGLPSSTLFSEASQDSFTKLEVDVTFQGMVSESSLDLVSKFETLAAQITDQQEQDTSSKLNTPVKKEPGVDDSEQSRKIDGFVSLSLKNF